MAVRSFDEPSLSPAQQLPALWHHSSDSPPHDMAHERRAITELIRLGELSQMFGKHGEYEVRTTMETRQAWYYRCAVFCRGKPLGMGFSPIVIDRTRQMQRIRRQKEATEAMRLSFAMEAVNVHLSRCASLQEYLVMASIYAEPPRPLYWHMYATLGILIGAVLLAIYGLWTPAHKTDLMSSLGTPLPPMQWAQNPVIYRHVAGQPFIFPLPALSGVPSDVPVQIDLEDRERQPSWIHLYRDTHHISGVPPLASDDRTYPLSILARSEQGSASRLQILLAINGQGPALPSQLSSAPKQAAQKSAVNHAGQKPTKSPQKNPRRDNTRQTP